MGNYVRKRKQRRQTKSGHDPVTKYKIGSTKWKAFQKWLQGEPRNEIVLALANDVKAATIDSYLAEFNGKWKAQRDTGDIKQSKTEMSGENFLNQKDDVLLERYYTMTDTDVIELSDTTLDKGDVYLELAIRNLI
jgi:hypothetical protein